MLGGTFYARSETEVGIQFFVKEEKIKNPMSPAGLPAEQPYRQA